jgi:hypothetical protein
MELIWSFTSLLRVIGFGITCITTLILVFVFLYLFRTKHGQRPKREAIENTEGPDPEEDTKAPIGPYNCQPGVVRPGLARQPTGFSRRQSEGEPSTQPPPLPSQTLPGNPSQENLNNPEGSQQPPETPPQGWQSNNSYQLVDDNNQVGQTNTEILSGGSLHGIPNSQSPPVSQSRQDNYGPSVVDNYGPSVVDNYGPSVEDNYGPSVEDSYGPPLVDNNLAGQPQCNNGLSVINNPARQVGRPNNNGCASNKLPPAHRPQNTDGLPVVSNPARQVSGHNNNGFAPDDLLPNYRPQGNHGFSVVNNRAGQVSGQNNNGPASDDLPPAYKP